MSDNREDGVSCDHYGCLSRISHPCKGCGRIAGQAMGKREKKFRQWFHSIGNACNYHESWLAWSTAWNERDTAELLAAYRELSDLLLNPRGIAMKRDWVTVRNKIARLEDEQE